MIKTCEICGKTFENNRPSAKYCSDDCRVKGKAITHSAWQKAHRKGKYKSTLKRKRCVICCSIFIPSNANQICCCDSCSEEHKKRMDKLKYEKAQKKTPKKDNKKAIIDIAAMARKEGMTYGQYVAKYNI